MPNADGGETREEYEERLRIVRATQIFGDTPTDPTIGDVVVPAHDEEAANVAAAEVADQAENDEDGDAADLSEEEAKRQLEPLDAEAVDEAADDDSDDADADASDDSEDDSDDKRTAAEVISDIESASSVEEVDRLAEGDDRVTVQRAADKKREELA
jgi:hypothetical protein